MRRTLQLERRRRANSGFSLIELLFAMLILTVGVLGGMIVIITAIASNSRNRSDTAAVALAQSTMDRIVVLTVSAGVQTTQITDCDGTAHSMTTAPGGAPLIDLANVANGVQAIDFTQAPVAGYQMIYKLCATGAADGLATGNPQLYDVRWNVSNKINAPNGGSTELVMVAAKNVSEGGNGTQGRFFNLPVTLRALRGN
jgi:prepilin-type N-terminal cleavage/methylation domain-containing protein